MGNGEKFENVYSFLVTTSSFFVCDQQKYHNSNFGSNFFFLYQCSRMFSFESFVFTMLLVSSTEAGSTSIRSPVSDWSRRLSFPAIAGYKPQTLVTDHVSHNWCWVLVRLLAK
jgi:hypothetical protein